MAGKLDGDSLAALSQLLSAYLLSPPVFASDSQPFLVLLADVLSRLLRGRYA